MASSPPIKLGLPALHKNAALLNRVVIGLSMACVAGMAGYNIANACKDHRQQMVSAVPMDTFQDLKTAGGDKICLRYVSLPSATVRAARLFVAASPLMI